MVLQNYNFLKLILAEKNITGLIMYVYFTL